MSNAIFIDPGVTDTGIAIFKRDTDRLFAAARFHGKGFQGDMMRVMQLADQVVGWAAKFRPFSLIGFEWPQIYRDGFDPNRLLPLAALNGAIGGLLLNHISVDSATRTVLPRRWKGKDKKKVAARHILAALRPGEIERMEEYKDFLSDLVDAEHEDRDLDHPAHNTLDAIGIGLYFLGRLSLKGRGEDV